MKTRVNYISFINVIAAVAVVILHANGSFWGYKNTLYWSVSNAIECIFFFGVPVFFMLSGATLIDYRERYSTKEFFKKRFIKTVIPFVFWSLMAMVYNSRHTIQAMITGKPNNGLGWTVGSVVDGILNAKFFHIYWFFIPLFCIYLFIPLFALIPKEKRIRVFTYIIAVLAVLCYAIPFILKLLDRFAGFKMGSPFIAYLGEQQYFIYPLLGYVLHKQELSRNYRWIIYAAAVAGLLAHMLGTLLLSRADGKIVTLFKDYYNLPCLLYSAGVFLLIKELTVKIKSEKINRFVTWFQGYTFPVYLMHLYWLYFLGDHISVVKLETTASLVYVIGASVLSIVLSVLTTMLLRLIPVLRHIVP